MQILSQIGAVSDQRLPKASDTQSRDRPLKFSKRTGTEGRKASLQRVLFGFSLE